MGFVAAGSDFRSLVGQPQPVMRWDNLHPGQETTGDQTCRVLAEEAFAEQERWVFSTAAGRGEPAAPLGSPTAKPNCLEMP